MPERSVAFAMFLAFCLVWGVLGSLALKASIAHPLAIGAVWIFGFVWGAGYFASSPKGADSLVACWLGMLIGIALLGGALYSLLLPFS